jgi:hypothetical protein
VTHWNADEGVDARAAFAAGLTRRSIPPPPMPPKRPGHPAALPIDPPPDGSEAREDLRALAADAVRRAWELAVGASRDAGLVLGSDADLARRAERALGTPGFSPLARHCGIPGRELTRWALAWRYGGEPGLEVLRGQWNPATELAGVTELIKAARVALSQAAGSGARVAGNQVTAGRLQLRIGRDLLWYPYAHANGDWEPAGPPQPDPARAIALL